MLSFPGFIKHLFLKSVADNSIGTMESLKNVKKDVMEMRKGSECGIGFEGWSNFQVGDQIQCYETKEEKRFL